MTNMNEMQDNPGWPAVGADWLDALGWALILIGFPLGNTTIGLAVLLVAFFTRIITRQPLLQSCIKDAVRQDRFHVWVTAFLWVTVLSALLSDNPRMGLAVSLAYFLIFTLILRGSAIFFLPVVRRRLTPIQDKIIAAILISSIVGSLYAMYAYFVWGNARAMSVSMGINGLGTIAAFVTIMTIAFAIDAWNQNRGMSLLALTAAVLAAASLILSFSRGGWLGLAVSAIVFVIFLLRSGTIGWKSLLTVTLITAIAFTGMLATFPPVQDRLISGFQIDSNMDRIVIWQATVDMIRDNPLLGVGGGNFPTAYNKYRIDDKTHTMSFAHNIILQMAAEYGLIGLLTITVVITMVVMRGVSVASHGGTMAQALFAGYLGILAHEFFDNITHGMNGAGLFWLLSGIFIYAYQTRSDNYFLKRTESVSPTPSQDRH